VAGIDDSTALVARNREANIANDEWITVKVQSYPGREVDIRHTDRRRSG
jgi:hypothetical protein